MSPGSSEKISMKIHFYWMYIYEMKSVTSNEFNLFAVYLLDKVCDVIKFKQSLRSIHAYTLDKIGDGLTVQRSTIYIHLMDIIDFVTRVQRKPFNLFYDLQPGLLITVLTSRPNLIRMCHARV